jgi:hypothetical protein
MKWWITRDGFNEHVELWRGDREPVWQTSKMTQSCNAGIMFEGSFPLRLFDPEIPPDSCRELKTLRVR